MITEWWKMINDDYDYDDEDDAVHAKNYTSIV
jgi:hypothetical protein